LHHDPAVRLAAAAVWPSLDDAARALLRDDPNGDVAAAASPALACHAFVSQADTDDHARIHGAHLTPDERLTVALGTLGRRSIDAEIEHVSCVLTAVEIVLAGLFPDETRLAERAATVAAAALRSVGVVVPLGDERLAPIGMRVYGRGTGMAWQDRLIALSTPPSKWDWDGSQERAAKRASQQQAQQQYDWDEQRRESNRVSSALENELAERIRRGEYPALWRDRPRQAAQPHPADRPTPKRRPPGF
jgi:hypothetical protein